MTKTCLLAATTLASFVVAFSPAYAANASRAWVSGHGTDTSTCGAPTAPCRTLQYVHDNIIAAGGEIDVLDPAGYGAVTITKALSIVNDGVGTAGVQQGTTGATAITINAGSTDTVTLRGLDIDGLGAGQSGISVQTAGAVQVVGCVVRHFTAWGIVHEPTNAPITLTITNSIFSDNGETGIFVQESNGTNNQPVVINMVTVTNNSTGIFVGYSHVMVSNSVIATNGTGVGTELGADVRLAKNVIFANSTGVNLSGGTVYSYGDNYLNDNGTDVSGGSLTNASTR